MARQPRIDIGGYPYHILNRANARLPIFFEEADFVMFEDILRTACDTLGMRMLAYCLMPNHFHLVLYPHNDGDLQRFMQWVTLTHTQRWHTKNNTVGTGHLYQGRYKSVLVQDDTHLLSLIRYVERNPLRANLVQKLDNWQFSSYWRRQHGGPGQRHMLSEWPIDVPSDYESFIHDAITIDELEEIRASIQSRRMYGSEGWKVVMSDQLGLPKARPRGRPVRGN